MIQTEDFSFLSKGKENNRTENFLLITSQTKYRLAHNQKEIISMIFLKFESKQNIVLRVCVINMEGTPSV